MWPFTTRKLEPVVTKTFTGKHDPNYKPHALPKDRTFDGTAPKEPTSDTPTT